MIDWSGPLIFDRWRDYYDLLTWQDQIEFYDEVARRWPRQNHYPLGWFKTVVGYLSGKLETFSVFEVGGWQGHMAAELLAEYDIIEWVNYEVCQWAVDNSVCSDSRYLSMVPGDFPWNVALPELKVFITSHTLEHIKSEEVNKLFANLPDSFRFMAHALPPNISADSDWADYGGSHILDCGIDEIDKFAIDAGFSVMEKLSGISNRLYER